MCSKSSRPLLLVFMFTFANERYEPEARQANSLYSCLGEEMTAMPVEPDIKHDKVPNLKLVMNPEGRIHDYNDLPEEEVPDMDQVAMVGNPEIAKTLVEGMNNCMGRGKASNPATLTPPATAGLMVNNSKTSPSFAGSFRQVFDSRRGMFEKNVAVRDRFINTTQSSSFNTPIASSNQLMRSKTLPDIPTLEDIAILPGLKRPGLTPPSPVVPKRSSSKQMVQMLNDDSRRPLRSFFSNA